MSQSDLSLGVDDSMDDLPRTLRREKEARAAQAARTSSLSAGSAVNPQAYLPESGALDEPLQPAEVRALRIPFFHLMFFFIKAVLAAIPALILLVALLWLAGDILMTYFPWLVKVKVQIYVPNL
jgi:hypothetical protein